MNLIKYEGEDEIDIDLIKDNPYAILGVSKDATDDEIIRAYKLLAARYHPDRTEGRKAFVKGEKNRGEMFLLLGVAKQTLLDPKKRALYDEYYIFGNETGQKTYREALGQIQHMFAELVRQSPHLEYTNIKESMVVATQKSIDAREDEIIELKDRLEKMKKTLKRISGHGKKGNRLVGLLKAQVEIDEKQTIGKIGQIKSNILICEEVLAILEEFECTFEKMEQSPLMDSLTQNNSFFGGFR